MASKRTRSPVSPTNGLSDEVRWYCTSKGIDVESITAPSIRTPEPVGFPGAVFSPTHVDRVLAAFGQLRHTKGQWAGNTLQPDPWQIAYIIAPIFGWVCPSEHDPERYVRIIRNAYVEVPRKNGKTTLSGGIALYMTGADGEQGAEVYAVAAAKNQAKFLFDPVKQLAQSTPALKGLFRPLAEKIIHPPSGSFFQVVASVGDLIHGSNPHSAVIDELHVHKSADVVEAVESGTGAREQPLVLIITTADDGRADSVYDRKRTKIERMASGVSVDPRTYGVVWCASENDDPFSEQTWRKANPGYGVSPSRSFLEEASAKAKESLAELASFKRLHLGLRTKQTTPWVDIVHWDACLDRIESSEWFGKMAYGGLDLSSSSDLTAFVLKSQDLVHAMFWLPEDRVDDIEYRCQVPLRQWVQEGWLRLTEGNVVDYAKVRQDIEAEVARLGAWVGSIGYDPWNSTETVQMLETSGFVMVPCRQGYGSLSAPTKHLERLILGSSVERRLLRHDGNPVMRWCVDCVEVKKDENQNVRPVKPDRNRSSKRIDGVLALVMADREEMSSQEQESSAGDWIKTVSKTGA